jgi:hypothetical protein
MAKTRDAGQEGRGKLNLETDPTEEIFSSVSKTVGDIRNVRQRMNQVQIKSLYEIGKILIRDWQKLLYAGRRSEIYRKDFWERFSKEVDIHEKTLRDCKRFAERFDESQVREMIKHGMTWTHVVHLLSLRTEKEEEDFVKRVAEEGLTAAALHKEISEKYGNRREGSGKQKKLPEPPKSLKTGLKRAHDIVTRLNDEHEHALFCDDFDLAEKIETGSSDEITEETRDQVDNLIKSYEKLATNASEIVKWLREARPWIDVVFEERKRAEKESEPKSGKEPRSIMLSAAARSGRPGLAVVTGPGK